MSCRSESKKLGCWFVPVTEVVRQFLHKMVLVDRESTGQVRWWRSRCSARRKWFNFYNGLKLVKGFIFSVRSEMLPGHSFLCIKENDDDKIEKVLVSRKEGQAQ